MPRRVTIPDNHVALILRSGLADELQSLLRGVRRDSARYNAKMRNKNPDLAEGEAVDQRELIAGDILLALFDAKEA